MKKSIKVHDLFSQIAEENKVPIIKGVIVFGLYYDEIEYIIVPKKPDHDFYILYVPELHKAHSKNQMALLVTSERPDIREKANENGHKELNEDSIEFILGIEETGKPFLTFPDKEESTEILVKDFSTTKKVLMSLMGGEFLSSLLAKIS